MRTQKLLNSFLFRLIISVLVPVFGAQTSFGQAKFGDNRTVIQAGSLMELESTNKGFLNVRLSTPQMMSIPVTPASRGMMIYNIDSACICVFDGAAWKNVCSDTNFVNKKLAGKLNISDTAAMLSTYLRSVYGVKYTDTALMLTPYARKQALADTAWILRALIANKVSAADTAAMLAPYVRRAELRDTAAALRWALNGKVNYTDTAAMLYPYARKQALADTAAALRTGLNGKVNYTDTAAMLIGYARKGKLYSDSLTLALATEQRVKYTDTASMLLPYARKQALHDTASNLRTLIGATKSGLIDTAAAIRSTISNRETAIRYSLADTSSTLRALIGATKSGLIDTAAAIRSTISNRETAIRYSLADTSSTLRALIGATKSGLIDTAAAIRSTVNTKVAYADTASMLLPYARKQALNDTASNLRSLIGSTATGLVDTASAIRTTINNRETAIRSSLADTSSTLRGLIGSTAAGLIDTAAAIRSTVNTKVAYADTASMLLPYARKQALNDTASNLRSLIGSTATGLVDTASAIRSTVNTKVAYADTASMLLPYARKQALNDTASNLRSLIGSTATGLIDTAAAIRSTVNTKVAYADTASMLLPYARKQALNDTASNLRSLIGSTATGLIDTASAIRTTINNRETAIRSSLADTSSTLRGLIGSTATGLIDTASAIRTTINNREIAIRSSLADTSSTLRGLIGSTATGLIDTAAAIRSTLNTKVAYADTASMLLPYARKQALNDTASTLRSLIGSTATGLVDTAAAIRSTINNRETAIRSSLADTSSTLRSLIGSTATGLVDTAAAIRTTINNRETAIRSSLADTSSTLRGLIGSTATGLVDTAAAIRSTVNTKVAYADTASMLLPYARKQALSDTASNLRSLIGSTATGLIDTAAAIRSTVNTKVAYTDTASMLLPYARKQALNDTASTLRSLIGSTATGLVDTAAAIRSTINNRETAIRSSLADTSSTLRSLIGSTATGLIDTAAAIRSTVNTKVAYTDTASMLLPYARKQALNDTASNLRSLIGSTTTGLIDTAAAIRSTVNTKVAYADTASMLLPYARKQALNDTASNLRSLIGSTATGLIDTAAAIRTTINNRETAIRSSLADTSSTLRSLIGSTASGLVDTASAIRTTINNRETAIRSSLADTSSTLRGLIGSTATGLIDTAAAIRSTVNTKVAYADTASMLLPYARKQALSDTASNLRSLIGSTATGLIDTASAIRTTINNRETAIRSSLADTSSTLRSLIGSTATGLIDTAAAIRSTVNTKVAYADTASMLLPYARKQALNDTASTLRSLIGSTATGLVDTAAAIRSTVNTKVAYADTASMLLPYARKQALNDTASNLRSLIGSTATGLIDTAAAIRTTVNTKVAYADTASMLLPYARKQALNDTASTLRSLIGSTATGLIDTAAAIRTTVNTKVAYTDTASMLLPYARKQALNDTASNLRSLIGSTATGLVDTASAIRTTINNRETAIRSSLADTSSTLRGLIGSTASGLVDTAAAIRSTVTTKVAYADTASMLLPYARKQALNDTASSLRSLIGSTTTGLIDTASAIRTTINNRETAIRSSLADTSSTLRGLIGSTATGLIDTAAAIRSTVNTKVAYTDTASMLSPYARKQALSDTASNLRSLIGSTATGLIDTAAAIRSTVNTKVAYADTASMLSPYARKQALNDTASTLRSLIGSTSTGLIDTAAAIRSTVNTKVAYADTASMLLPYARKQALNDTASNLRSLIGSTATGLIDTAAAIRSTVNTKVAYTDTASMLLPYARKQALNDTASNLRSLIGSTATGLVDTAAAIRSTVNTKVAYADTASMLLPYARKQALNDTASNLRSLIGSTTTGLIDTAAAIRSTLNTKVAYADTASMLLPYARKQALSDTASNLRSLIGSTATGLVDTASAIRTTINNRETAIRSSLADTSSTLRSLISSTTTGLVDTAAAIRSTVNTKVAYADTASMLLPYARKQALNDTASNLRSLIGSTATGLIDTAAAIRSTVNTKVAYTDTASMLLPYARKQALNDTASTLRSLIGSTATGLIDTATAIRTTINSRETAIRSSLADTSSTLRSLIGSTATGLVDTAAAIRSTVNTKVAYADTASMLLPYARKQALNDTASTLRGLITSSVVDTSSLSTRINQRVKYTDTSAMLSPYLRSALGVKYTDTASMLNPYARKQALSDTASTLRGLITSSVVDTSSLSTRINQRVRYTDTAAMLSPYLRSALGVKYTDTASMLLPYARKQALSDTASTLRGLITSSVVDTSSLSTRINQRVKYTDTAAMLANYATKAKVLVDSNALAANINLRVKYTDTASMLLPYARKQALSDTASTLRGLITSSVVDTSSLSTRINQRVRYTDTATMLSPYLRSALGVKYTDTTSMLNPYARKQALSDTASTLRGLITSSVVDTSSLSIRINQRVKYTDTAAMLSPYLRSALGVKYTDTASMLLPYARKQALNDTASTLRGLITSSVVDTSSLSTRINQRVKYTDTAAMLSPYLRSALGVKYTDTATMLNPYARKQALSDTASTLRGLITSSVVDTSS